MPNQLTFTYNLVTGRIRQSQGKTKSKKIKQNLQLSILKTWKKNVEQLMIILIKHHKNVNVI